MIKRLCVILLATVMIVCMSPAVSASQVDFADVTASDYFFDAVAWAVDKAVAKGLTENEFGPYIGCARGHVVTFLWRMAGSPEPSNNNNPFADVAADQYYSKAILWAVESGITNGMTETTFEPDGVCTRGQIVTFLWRYYDTPTTENDEHTFSDVFGAEYFYKAVLWAVENGITNGMTETTFESNATCTRGQVVTFLYRAKELAQPKKPGHSHTYGEWVTDWVTTSYMEGRQSRNCKCGEKEYQYIPMVSQEEIDVDALVQYALEYAEDQGFTIDLSLNETNAGYYPALDFAISTMEEGRQAVRGMVDNTKYFLTSAHDSIEGARYNMRIEFYRISSFGVPVYWLRDFYG